MPASAAESLEVGRKADCAGGAAVGQAARRHSIAQHLFSVRRAAPRLHDPRHSVKLSRKRMALMSLSTGLCGSHRCERRERLTVDVCTLGGCDE